MLTRIVAIIAGMVSMIALGFAMAQIMPLDRHRLFPAQEQEPTPKAAIKETAPQPQGRPSPSPSAQGPAVPLQTQGKPLPKVSPFAGRAPDAEMVADLGQLDPRIVKTREKLIDAARSGKIERLNVVFQMNETLPVFSRGAERDPVAFWKSVSGDGQGVEVLAILRNILELPPARIHAGQPQEMVVWPYLAQKPLDALTPEQQVDLYRLVTAQDVRDMKTLGLWAFWRLGIGKDGTIHYFVAGQ